MVQNGTPYTAVILTGTKTPTDQYGYILLNWLKAIKFAKNFVIYLKNLNTNRNWGISVKHYDFSNRFNCLKFKAANMKDGLPRW